MVAKSLRNGPDLEPAPDVKFGRLVHNGETRGWTTEWPDGTAKCDFADDWKRPPTDTPRTVLWGTVNSIMDECANSCGHSWAWGEFTVTKEKP